ncbi:hypothetical protein [Ulvibacterium sp.]|uniref:MORN repeat-containing protein n=1 Tax=Ulvibacterium sp. TaxID=2665914 RepID=UPI00260B9FCC|nr:hypothetical protein [Ulvibacterium sp.]
MKKQNRKIISYLLVLITVGILVFYQLKTNKLQNELQANRAFQEQIDTRLAVYNSLLQIDSTLVKGNYKAALSAYQEQLNVNEKNDSTGIRLRIALAKKIIKMQDALRSDASLIAQLRALDSSQIEQSATPKEIRQFDSLSFALEKTKVRLARMENQLQKKSFGQYLTFTSSKGSLMHYVGEVKNKKANGHGLALLDTGSRYEGEWKNNQRHGRGTFYWPDGEYYVGDYVNDKRNGQGTYYWPNGEKYTGAWKDDRRSGEGIFYGKDGKIIANGVWQEDELVQAAKKQKKESR